MCARSALSQPCLQHACVQVCSYICDGSSGESGSLAPLLVLLTPGGRNEMSDYDIVFDW